MSIAITCSECGDKIPADVDSYEENANKAGQIFLIARWIPLKKNDMKASSFYEINELNITLVENPCIMENISAIP